MGSRLIVEVARGRRRGGERSRSRSPAYRDRRRYSRSPPRRDRGGGYGSGGYGGDRDRRRERGRARSTQWRLIVENLPPRCSWQDLKDYFRKTAEVTYTEVSRDRDNEGLVDFATQEDMERALKELDGQEMNGSVLRLQADQSRMAGVESTGNQRRGRSHSRSRSPRRRSPSRD